MVQGGRQGRGVVRAWVIWTVAVLAYVVAVLNRSSFAATGPAAAERFGVSAGALSLLAVVQLAVYAALQVPAGVLVDRFGPRRLIATGALLVAIGQLVLALTTVFAFALGGRVLVGAGDAVTFISVLRLIPAWFPARRVPLLNQVAGMLGQLGQVLSAVPLAALVSSAGWTPAYLGTAATAVLTAALAAAALRDTPTTATPSTAKALVATDGVGGLLEVARAPSTRLAFWCHFVSLFPANAFGFLWGFPFLTAGQGRSSAAAQGLITLFVAAVIVTGPLFGAVAGRRPNRHVELICASVAAQMIVWAAVLLWPGPAPLALLAALAVAVGSGDPASVVAFDIARSGVHEHQIGRASGITNVGGFTSTVAVILLIGLALDVQGAGPPELWSPETFRLAMLAQVPLWAIGLFAIVYARRGRSRSDGAEAQRTSMS